MTVMVILNHTPLGGLRFTVLMHMWGFFFLRRRGTIFGHPVASLCGG